MTTDSDGSPEARQYVRALVASDDAWAAVDAESGLPIDPIEYSYHDLIKAFDAGRASTHQRKKA